MSRPQGRIGAYDLIERVGEGGMAEVWLARREGLSGAVKSCALKLMLPRLAADERHRKMFLQEARLALKLSHANIVSVFDAGEADGRLYIAMDWIDGVDLRAFSQKIWDIPMRFSIPVVCHIVGELLNALRYAHTYGIGGESLGIIHRDISPHNVLVSSSGEVKLADFGIARVIGEDTSHMHVKGKLRYMPPEQFQGEATQASDLFAVGAIVHELLTGRRFREGIEAQEHWIRVLMTDQAVPPLGRDGVPPELENLRQGLLQGKQSERLQTADEALMLLHQCDQWRNSTIELRKMYERYFNVQRRTGLTRGDGALPAMPDVPPAMPRADRLPSGLEPVEAGDAEPDAPVFFRRRRATSEQASAADSGSAPSAAAPPVASSVASSRAPDAGSRVDATAFLADGGLSAHANVPPTMLLPSQPEPMAPTAASLVRAAPVAPPATPRPSVAPPASPPATEPESAAPRHRAPTMPTDAGDATRTSITAQVPRDRTMKIVAIVAVIAMLATAGFVAVLKLTQNAAADTTTKAQAGPDESVEGGR
jgi:serine/threonine protein kinase